MNPPVSPQNRCSQRHAIMGSVAVTCAVLCSAMPAQETVSRAPRAADDSSNSHLLDAAPPVTELSRYIGAQPGTNSPSRADAKQFDKLLDQARTFRAEKNLQKAEELLIELLGEAAPESVRQDALVELAGVAQDGKDFARAQQVYAQFLTRWPNDLRVPEVLLRQGRLFRQMGLNNLALTKFYGVMTSALVLKNDHLNYYVQLVQQAQTEIADTHYALGKYGEASEFFRRLLKQTNSVGKSEILFKLTRCHSALGNHADTIAEARTYLETYPNAPEQPEIRFHLAVALKELGRDSESLEQVLLLLQEQKAVTRDRSALWSYWQQRAGNLIANHLYREGDYPRALEIYLRLAELDTSASWQVPVKYQAGITYERLWQPQKAAEIYADILRREKEFVGDAPAGLKTVFDMARWRAEFIQWQEKAEQSNRRLQVPPLASGGSGPGSLESNSTP